MSLFYRVCISIFSLICINNAYAWGPLGHQVICDIAWRQSSSNIRTLLAQIAKRQGYNTFAESCVWADHVRGQSDYKWLAPLHYVNVPRSAELSSQATCLRHPEKSQPKCVLTAIPYFSQHYRDTVSRKEKDEAILLIGHFVGDLHQPLHVSYADDRGGTRKKVIFEGKVLSLHQLWDTQIVTCNYQGGWRQLGAVLSKKAEPVNHESDILDWADESLIMTRQIYQNLSRRLPDSYCQQYHSMVLDRLALAGGRLASLLSSMLAP